MGENEEIPEDLRLEWRESVQKMRRVLFGDVSLSSGEVSTKDHMSKREMSGYLDDLFTDWRGQR